MATRNRYLTKSRFVTALDCPTKLYYDGKDEYANKKEEDEFLQALARGGMQVGELAKMYYPEGIDVEARSNVEAIRQTFQHLEKDQVTLFEPTIVYDNFLVRADILVKEENDIQLIEVKSKSYDPDDPSKSILTQSGYIRSGWDKYVYDVAFQYWVLSQAFPSWNITPYLMLSDTSKKATVDGLHQNFKVIEKPNGRYEVKIKEGLTADDIGEKILTEVNVSEVVNKILEGNELPDEKKTELQREGFETWVRTLAEHYVQDEKYPTQIGAKCKDCEFYVNPSELGEGEKSGFVECWTEALGWNEEEFDKPHIFDLWYYMDKEERLNDEIYQIEQLPEDLYPAPKEATLSENDELSREQRQTLQVLAAKGVLNEQILLEGLQDKIEEWQFPLHFIDFEVHIGSAIPFHKGMRPYEPVAFQFSEHVMNSDFSVEHRSEWLNTEPGQFPNFDFVRALKDTLSDDDGTVFMYYPFETRILNAIADQIREAEDEVGDGDQLLDFIDSLTDGNREMVDLHELTQLHYYHPRMRGSISLKDVLPATLHASDYLANKYSQPYQGNNFDDMNWYRTDGDGQLQDPYDLLPPIGHGVPGYKEGEEVIAMGSAAMLAYARLQFDDLKKGEREAVNQALLQYCELDTLAMVMIAEHWLSEFGYLE